MAPYARILFLLLQALRRRGFPLEAFAFGTRLTRITPFFPSLPKRPSQSSAAWPKTSPEGPGSA